jgi:hypothetical protein
MPRVEHRNRDFPCFGCAQVISGPYTALTRQFCEQQGINTINKERNCDIFCGQNCCTPKILTYHLSVCEKNSIILEDDLVNCEFIYVDANVKNIFMDIDLPHGGFVAYFE